MTMLNEGLRPAGRGSIEIDSGRRTPAGRHILNEHPLTKLLFLFCMQPGATCINSEFRPFAGVIRSGSRKGRVDSI